MAFVHGKETVVKVNGTDLSAFTNTSQLTRTMDSHDTTTYGFDSHRYTGGLMDGTFTMGGIYDNGASGPREILEPLVGDDNGASIEVYPEGEGASLPFDTFTGILTSYQESHPVADMCTWSADFQVSGDVVTGVDS